MEQFDTSRIGRNGSGSASRSRRWAERGVAFIACASALALGGAHVWVVLISTLGVALCGAFAFAGGSVRRIPAPALVLAGLGAYSLLQSLPLPLGLLQKLSPGAAEGWSRSLLPFGEQVRFGSLSLDPGASSVEAAKWLAYAVAFVLAASFGQRRGASPPIAVVFGSSLVVALVTLAHRLAGATKVFGIYEPQLGPSKEHIGPILNANCLAGYLLLGVLCGLGFALSSKTAARRLLCATGTAIIMGVTVLAGSRGGFVALALGIAGFGVVAYKAQRRGQVRRLRWYDWAGAISAIAVAAAFSLLGVQDSWFELSQTDVSKLKMGAWVLPMLRDFPVFGVGRGAFESVFPVYKPVADNIIYANPETIIPQWLSEWGLIAGAIGLATLVWLLRPSRLGFGRRPLISAALIGVAALVLQNFVDFSLELFAPALAVVIVLGGCWGQAHSFRAAASGRLHRELSYGLVVLCFVCVALAFVRGRSVVSLERHALQEEYGALAPGDDSAAARLWSELHRAMQRHPAEPYFPRLGAALALRQGHADPLQWIGRALERGPVDSRTHWILSHALHLHGFLAQALLEARLAVEYDKNMASAVGSTVAHWSPRLDDIERASPPGRPGSQVALSAATALDPSTDDALRQQLFLAAIQKDPSFAPAHRALAEQLLIGLEHDWYDVNLRAGYESTVINAADSLDRLRPDSADGSRIRARVYTLTGQTEDADRVLSAHCPRLEQQERVKCWRALLSVADSPHGNGQLTERVADLLVKTACALQLDCESALLQAGDAMIRVGHWPEALVFFQRAAQIDPKATTLLRAADAAAVLGQMSVAARTLEQAAGHARANPALRKEIQTKLQTLLSSTPN